MISVLNSVLFVALVYNIFDWIMSNREKKGSTIEKILIGVAGVIGGALLGAALMKDDKKKKE